MLGTNADAFFTTNMRTSVRNGGNAEFASGGGMPAPFALSGPDVREFLPMGNDAAVQIAAETKKFLGMTIPVALGAAALAFLFLTEPGTQIRARLGF